MDFLNSFESTGGGGLPEGEDDHEDEGGGPVFENPYTCGDQILWPFDFTRPLSSAKLLELAFKDDTTIRLLNSALNSLHIESYIMRTGYNANQLAPENSKRRLRSHQLQGVLTAFRNRDRTIVVRLPTGAGKTLIIIVLLQMLHAYEQDFRNKIWPLAPTNDLLIQHEDTFREPGFNVVRYDPQAADREAILVFFLNFSLLLLY